MLCRLGARSLARAIASHDPDVVVSTYPAITVVLSELRRRRRIGVPTVATITDMTGLFFWAQRGIDTHLVMYEASVSDVERIAGPGSAEVVRPLISAEFLEPRERGAARAALALPEQGRVVVVSGGGWGVGDIAGAVERLVTIEDATIICLAGRNEQLRGRLTERFADQPRVRVLGFTERMPELLAAADVLVHSTGGVTCLEAMASACPVVSYGLPVGHAKLNTQLMADHGLLILANSTDELLEQVKRRCAAAQAPTRALAAAPGLREAVDIVMSPPHRARLIARWRLRVATIATAGSFTFLAGCWILSTDELNVAAAAVFGVHQVYRVRGASAVAVIVRTKADKVALVARRLHRDGVRASFAFETMPSEQTLAVLRRYGDVPMPAVRRSHFFGWVATRGQLHREAHALHLHHRFYYLEPSTGLSFGQLLLARTDNAEPVHGSVLVDASSPRLERQPRAGDVVVAWVDGSATSLHSLDRLANGLASADLAGRPFSSVVRS